MEQYSIPVTLSPQQRRILLLLWSSIFVTLVAKKITSTSDCITSCYDAIRA